jgi:hypothetical protein
MLSHEEALLAAQMLYKMGWKYTYVWGSNTKGWHIRGSKYPPLSPPSFEEPWVQFDSEKDVAEWIKKNN